MARTVIEDSSGPAPVVEDTSGPAVGLIVGLLLAVVLIVLAVLFFRGTWNSTSNNPPAAPGNGGVPSAPAQQNQPSGQASP